MRSLLKEVGLLVDAISDYEWQLWVGTSDEPQTRIVQSNGSGPRVRDYSDNLVSGFLEQIRVSPGVFPRYVAYVWADSAIVPSLSDKTWYWLTKNDGQSFTKLRPLYLRDGAGPQELLTLIVLGETKINKAN